MVDKQRSEGSEGGSQGQIWGKEHSRQRAMEVQMSWGGMHLWRTSERATGRRGRHVMEARSCRASQGPGRSLAFTLSKKRTLWGEGGFGTKEKLRTYLLGREEREV